MLTCVVMYASWALGCGKTERIVGVVGRGGAGPVCEQEGARCGSANQCCGGTCLAGWCRASCISDDMPCDDSVSCCSGTCSEQGVCEARSKSCKTEGNDCQEGGTCCSAYCEAGRCSTKSSFCRQEQEICVEDDQCCSLSCDKADGDSLGSCASVPRGPTNCSQGVAGNVCDSCNDCCSRLCLPYEDTGLSICVAASGCRQTGELCLGDAECCGGDPESGLPGAGNVQCVRETTAQVGVCRNALSCSPHGNACHLQDYQCSISAAANKCCDAEGGAEGRCVLDSQGVPRCSALLEGTCRTAGETCGMDEDCCGRECRLGPSGGWTCQE